MIFHPLILTSTSTQKRFTLCLSGSDMLWWKEKWTTYLHTRGQPQLYHIQLQDIRQFLHLQTKNADACLLPLPKLYNYRENKIKQQMEALSNIYNANRLLLFTLIVLQLSCFPLISPFWGQAFQLFLTTHCIIRI